MAYDLIIKNGLVFDGKGNKPEKKDIGIKGDEIKKLGDLSKDEAREIINAEGRYVAPGFIDLTTHSDTHWTLFTCPSQESFLRQGITTILGGNCGSSLAPILGEESLKDIERWIDVSKVNINWRSMKEFLTETEKRKIGVNFCTLVGFNTLYKTVKEPEAIKFILESSLDEGAFGISAHFGLTDFEGFKEEQIADIFSVVKKRNSFIKHHLDDEGGNVLPATAKVIALARNTGAKSHITHFKALGRNTWSVFSNAIDMIKNAAREKISLTCDFFPYTSTGSQLITFLPSWFKKLPAEDALKILKNKDDFKRKNLLEYISKLTLHYDRLTVASVNSKIPIHGKTIEMLGKSMGLPGEEIILNLLEAGDLRVSIFNEVIAENNIESIAREKFSAIASDGVGYDMSLRDLNGYRADAPHPRSFGAFPRAFEWLVKNKAIISWEQAVYKMSGLPAQILDIKDRGVVMSGFKADLVIFNPENIKDLSSYANPFFYPQGVDAVIVNGVCAIRNSEFTGMLAGRVLRK